ncbi:3-keto-disaccharide hydrolase [Pontiella agarivorans]|uniref:DUF1080 domain-containing protein n=1 Tax=Pontiella agarivorans TaxID=3038953 RepID=A0ABU5N097_9BACT|nr:DUF1080 domain-containing protein [Pontiella agarivorans]MDZ8119839.1 DUF1080 domain-containing protein [Pontiella agarivorans]
MKKLLILPAVALAIGTCAKPAPVPSYSSVTEAEKAHPDFSMVGEYISNDGKIALQANKLPGGKFLVAQYAGGLPGMGWNQSAIVSALKTPDELKTAVQNFQKVERVSPTLGKPQPDHAILKFPEDFTNVKNGFLMAGGKTRKNIGSFSMHLEFMLPFKPDRNLSSQDRCNSGIYIFNNYELQVMDSFGLDFEHPENNANTINSKNYQWCGSLYKKKLPDVTMCYPPLRWQTYDIDFTAPVLKDGEKVENARITVRHNGVLIHDDVELETGTGLGAKRPQLAEGPIFFQSHGTPVIYRNVWATPLKN